MRETVLLYAMQDKKQLLNIKRALMLLKIRICEVKKEDYFKPVGVLAGTLETEADTTFDVYEGQELDEPMMVMCGLTGSRVDQLLLAFRKNKIPSISLKAVLTATNQQWNSIQLYEELKEEHNKMHQ